MNTIVLVPISFFAFLAIVILVPAWLRHRSRMLALRALGDAIEKGRTADAALIERLVMPKPRPVGKWFALLNLGLGVGALCIGVALGLAVRLLGHRLGLDTEGAAGMMIGSFVNTSIGIGLTALGLISMTLFSGRSRPEPRWDYASVLALISLFFGVSGLAVSVGLALASYTYVVLTANEHTATGLLMGAIVNGCSGVGFTLLGAFILRSFVSFRES